MFKHTFTIWSPYGDVELTDLASQADTGDSYCSTYEVTSVEDPTTDPAFTEGAAEFFGLESEDDRDHRETGPDGNSRSYDPESGASLDSPVNHLVVVGTPVDGFTHYGPFTSGTEAVDAAEAADPGLDWWVVPLLPREALADPNADERDEEGHLTPTGREQLVHWSQRHGLTD